MGLSDLAEDRRIRAALRHPDKPGAGAKKRKKLPKKMRVHAVMAEHERGTLRSGSGKHVTKRDQAIAIAMSESGQSRNQKKGAGKGKGMPGGMRRNKNKGPGKLGGPGHGLGRGRGEGKGRKK